MRTNKQDVAGTISISPGYDEVPTHENCEYVTAYSDEYAVHIVVYLYAAKWWVTR